MSIQKVIKSTRALWHTSPVLEGFELLDRVERTLGAALPADYKWFLQFFSNGAEGDFEGMYLQVLPLSQVGEDYTLPEDMKHYVIFAVDGDEAYAFDISRAKDSANYPVVHFSLASRDASEVEDVAKDFEDLLRNLALRKRKPRKRRDP